MGTGAVSSHRTDGDGTSEHDAAGGTEEKNVLGRQSEKRGGFVPQQWSPKDVKGNEALDGGVIIS